MVGPIEDILSDFELSDEGYVLAWSYVICRFEKHRWIVKAFLRKLHTIEPIKTELGLKKLLDSVNGIIRGLNAAGEQMNDTFSRYLAYYVSTKVDAATITD